MILSANATEMCNRFGLRNGQFFANYACKNVWWELDGEFFGYGDLSAENVFELQRRLEEGEVFQAWNEHHMTDWQQTDTPMLRIKKDDIMYRRDIVEEAYEEEVNDGEAERS